MMSKAQKNVIRKHLFNELNSIQLLDTNSPLILENCADDCDFAAQLVSRGLDLALAQRAVQKSRNIQRALDRLGSAEFGICIDCGEPIGARRLMARPSTNLCVSCQEEREKDRNWS